MRAMSRLLPFLLLAPWPALRAQEPPTPPSVELPAPLAQVLRAYERAWSGRDPAGLAALFAEDGYVLPNGGAPVVGRAAIAKHYTGSGGPLALRAFRYALADSVAYILGGYAAAADRPDVGKFTLTLVRRSGQWQIVSDMDSPNRRP